MQVFDLDSIEPVAGLHKPNAFSPPPAKKAEPFVLQNDAPSVDAPESEPSSDEVLSADTALKDAAPEDVLSIDMPAKDTVSEEAPPEDAAFNGTETEDVSSEDVPPKKAPQKNKTLQKKPSRKAPPKKAPLRGKAPPGKRPPGKAPARKGPPKKGSPQKGPPRKGPPPKSTKELLIGLLIKISVTAALVWAVFTFVLGLSVHYGNNMFPAVHDGDLLVTYRLQKPFINAAVLYKLNGETRVGRVIALEGSVVDIHENGSLTVNGVTPAEEVFYATYQADGAPITFPYTVESGKVFILNDFRSDTNDSRSFGAVSVKDLKGPMLFTVRRRNF